MSEAHYPLVLVVWTDTISKSGWISEEDVDKWMVDNAWLVKSVGYLVRETEDFIVLAPGWAQNEKQYMGLTKIPRRWATIIPLEEPDAS